jgi:hypothetical protein
MPHRYHPFDEADPEVQEAARARARYVLYSKRASHRERVRVNRRLAATWLRAYDAQPWWERIVRADPVNVATTIACVAFVAVVVLCGWRALA